MTRILLGAYRNCALAVALCVGGSVSLAAQNVWETLTVPAGPPLESVAAPNEGLVIVAGKDGRILRSHNHGIAWTLPSSGTASDLHSIAFAGTTTGNAVGEEGVILRTTDGGATWTSQMSGAPYQIRGIHLLDQNIAVTAHPFLKTTNGGALWVNPNLSWEFVGSDVVMLGADTIMICGQGGIAALAMIMRSTDGGDSWNGAIQFEADQGPLRGIAFGSSMVGCAVGGQGLIYRTTDGGATWHKVGSGTTEILHDVAFVDGQLALVVGEKGTILATTDGGATWAPQQSGTMEPLRGVAIDFEGVAYAAGGHATGVVLRSAQATGVDRDENAAHTPHRVTPSPFMDAATIRFTTNHRAHVRIELTDALGALLGVPVDAVTEAGEHTCSVNGAGLAPGVYFYRVIVDGHAAVGKMVKID